jgi:hypothetical protein
MTVSEIIFAVVALACIILAGVFMHRERRNL